MGKIMISRPKIYFVIIDKGSFEQELFSKHNRKSITLLAINALKIVFAVLFEMQ